LRIEAIPGATGSTWDFCEEAFDLAAWANSRNLSGWNRPGKVLADLLQPTRPRGWNLWDALPCGPLSSGSTGRRNSDGAYPCGSCTGECVAEFGCVRAMDLCRSPTGRFSLAV